jgi:Tfp pilus assembly protein PilZ
VGVKDDLKNIIQKHIGEAVSSFFLEKSLAIINESAETKESLIAAADRISKRIGLFIDKDLAQTVFESLKVEIEKETLLQGTRRRYTRVTFCKKVRVRYDGAHYELDSEKLSEGGMYIRTKEPFPAGAELEITLSLGVVSKIYLTGVVVYETDPPSDSYKLPPGMAIEFKEIGDKEAEMLRRYVKRARD